MEGSALELLPDLVPMPKFSVGAKIGFDKVSVNLRYSLSRLQDKPRLQAHPDRDGTFVVCAYGPSLKDTWGGIVEEMKRGAVVCSTSGAHDFLLSRGIIPHFHADMDPQKRKAAFVAKPHKAITYLMASRCHPKVWRNLRKQNVVIWHMGDLGNEDALVSEYEADALMQPGVQCIGLNAIVLGRTLGYRRFSVYGMDCSYAGDATHAGAHNGTYPVDGIIEAWCGKRRFKTRPEWVKYIHNFADDMFPAMNKCSFAFHGDGLFQHYLKEKYAHAHHSGS